MSIFSAEISIEMEDAKLARALSIALQPDNRTAPPNVRLKTESLDNILRVEASVGNRPETLQATLDDLILCLQAAYLSLHRIL